MIFCRSEICPFVYVVTVRAISGVA